ncbi:MAG: geranylgeranylglycerol-phosphate geranylgeranyltransferase [Bacteroidota bacterium]
MKATGLLRIIRMPNLLMVVATMYLMRWSVIRPILGLYQIELQVSEIAFLCLVLSTVLITAAGYVINDYHDVKADRINQPGRVVIDSQISRWTALLLHWLMNLAGVFLGGLFSIIYHVPWMILIFAGAPMLLWLYSIRLKHQLLVGNLAVSLLTGTVPLLVILFEYPLLARDFSNLPDFFPAGIHALLFWVGSFSFFAFITNLIREVIKDAEDVTGDKESGSKTLPISCGYRKTKIFIISLSLLTVLFLGYFFLVYLTDWISLVYFIVCLIFPFILLIWKTITAASPKDYHFLSQLSKIIMLLGLLYAPVAHYIISYLTGG